MFDEILRAVDISRDLLIIVSPTCPPYRSKKEMAYSPIAIIGPGFGPGLLTSPSTRRPGLVANVDIAPTVLRYFGLDVPGPRAGRDTAGMSGRSMTWRESEHPLQDVLALSRRGLRLLELRWRFGPVYILSQFIILIAVSGLLLFWRRGALEWRQRLRLALLLAISVPLALLFLPPLDPGAVAQPYVIAAALAAAFTWLAWRGSAPLTALGALLTATTGVIVLDAMTGARLLGNSIISYNPMYGGRFHGIGNDLMGVAMACGAIGSAALVQESGGGRRAMWALAVWLAVIALAISAPHWGANWGGGVTAGFAFAVAYAAMRSGRPRLRHWLWGTAAGAAAGAILIALDLINDSHAWTHIGDSALLVGAGGVPAAAAIAARKFAGHLHVFSFAPYSALTLLALAIVLWLVMGPPRRLRAALEANRTLWGGIAGGTAGAVVAVIVNDSGVVAGASALGIITLTIAYAALHEDRSAP